MIIAGTGHRPPKLGGYSTGVRTKLEYFAQDVLEQGYGDQEELIVISGLSLGWDQAIAVAANRLDLRVWGYAPCHNMGSKWPQESVAYLDNILSYCEKVVYVHDGDYPGPWCMIKRDEAMVQVADKVLALWDGTEKGGTYATIQFARKLKKPWTNVWDLWETYHG